MVAPKTISSRDCLFPASQSPLGLGVLCLISGSAGKTHRASFKDLLYLNEKYRVIPPWGMTSLLEKDQEPQGPVSQGNTGKNGSMEFWLNFLQFHQIMEFVSTTPAVAERVGKLNEAHSGRFNDLRPDPIVVERIVSAKRKKTRTKTPTVPSVVVPVNTTQKPSKGRQTGEQTKNDTLAKVASVETSFEKNEAKLIGLKSIMYYPYPFTRRRPKGLDFGTLAMSRWETERGNETDGILHGEEQEQETLAILEQFEDEHPTRVFLAPVTYGGLDRAPLRQSTGVVASFERRKLQIIEIHGLPEISLDMFLEEGKKTSSQDIINDAKVVLLLLHNDILDSARVPNLKFSKNSRWIKRLLQTQSWEDIKHAFVCMVSGTTDSSFLSGHRPAPFDFGSEPSMWSLNKGIMHFISGLKDDVWEKVYKKGGTITYGSMWRSVYAEEMVSFEQLNAFETIYFCDGHEKETESLMVVKQHSNKRNRREEESPQATPEDLAVRPIQQDPVQKKPTTPTQQQQQQTPVQQPTTPTQQQQTPVQQPTTPPQQQSSVEMLRLMQLPSQSPTQPPKQPQPPARPPKKRSTMQPPKKRRAERANMFSGLQNSFGGSAVPPPLAPRVPLSGTDSRMPLIPFPMFSDVVVAQMTGSPQHAKEITDRFYGQFNTSQFGPSQFGPSQFVPPSQFIGPSQFVPPSQFGPPSQFVPPRQFVPNQFGPMEFQRFPEGLRGFPVLPANSHNFENATERGTNHQPR
jgi:hypothetical protein